HLKGSRQVVEKLQELVNQKNLQDKVELSGTFCMGNCQNGVSVMLDDKLYSLSPDSVKGFFEETVLPNVK
ncbi:MAG: (2Fe-2S) ferredoxin domain-containing protein, partial [Oscillospiraceae bacterium]